MTKTEPLDDEALITIVATGKNGEQESELTIRYTSDVLFFYLDGKEIFGGDWSNNFEPLFKRALEIWGEEPQKEK